MQSKKIHAVDLQNLTIDPANSAGNYALAIVEQEQFNEMLASTRVKLAPAKNMKKLLQESQMKLYDPIQNAMKRFPTLTREQAEEMAKAFGF